MEVSPNIAIFVKTFRGKTLTFDVDDHDSIWVVQEMIHRWRVEGEAGCRGAQGACSLHKLMFLGSVMEDASTLFECSVSEGATLYEVADIEASNGLADSSDLAEDQLERRISQCSSGSARSLDSRPERRSSQGSSSSASSLSSMPQRRSSQSSSGSRGSWREKAGYFYGSAQRRLRKVTSLVSSA